MVSCFVLATVGCLDSGVGPTRPPSCPPDSGGPTVRISTSQRARAVVPYLPVPYAAAPVTGRSRAQPMVGRASQWEFAHVGLTARLALPRDRPPTNSLLPSTAGSGRAGNHFHCAHLRRMTQLQVISLPSNRLPSPLLFVLPAVAQRGKCRNPACLPRRACYACISGFPAHSCPRIS